MIDETMDDGYALALGSVYQGGSWNSGDGVIKMAVFKTTDNGTTWDRKAMGTRQGAVRSLAVSPANSKIIFAGGYSYDGSYVRWSQLYMTTDGGASWIENGTTAFNQQNESVESIVFGVGNNNVVLACTERAVYRSANAGSSWVRISTMTYNNCILADPGLQDCYYLGSDAGVSRSTDGGLTWSPYGDGLAAMRVNCLTIDSVNRTLYAGTEGAGVCRLSLPATGVATRDEYGVPATMVLRQNYPNPFNPRTRIDLGVPEEGRYRLAVYNMLGQEVDMLVDRTLMPGIKSVEFDASRLSSGAYVYRLDGPKGFLIRKMLLMR
jgi:hypothetical protein